MVLIAFSLWLGAAALACGPFFIGQAIPEAERSISGSPAGDMKAADSPVADVPVARSDPRPIVAADVNAGHGDGSQIAYRESPK
jgi:hypothetical protein